MAEQLSDDEIQRRIAALAPKAEIISYGPADPSKKREGKFAPAVPASTVPETSPSRSKRNGPEPGTPTIAEIGQQYLSANVIPPERAAMYRYVRPLHDHAAESLIRQASGGDEGFRLGLPEIDDMIRGFRPGELALITGLPHSGKTQVWLNAMNNNRDRRIALFTPDEPAELVLSKLVALRTGEGADELEARLRAGDKAASRLVRDVAREDFANFLVFDDALTLAQMADALKEAEDHWGAAADACALDYMELLLSEGEGDGGVDLRINAVKRWVKDLRRFMLVMHQAKKGKRGKRLSMDDMRYGGGAQALFVLSAWRPRDAEDIDDWARHEVWDQIGVAVDKNKRPPSLKGEAFYHLDQRTGLMMPLFEAPAELDRRTQAEARTQRLMGTQLEIPE